MHVAGGVGTNGVGDVWFSERPSALSLVLTRRDLLSEVCDNLPALDWIVLLVGGALSQYRFQEWGEDPGAGRQGCGCVHCVQLRDMRVVRGDVG